MRKTQKRVIEYRVYDLPEPFPIIFIGGKQWHISDVRSNRLHFHNCLEVGICHTDSGIIEFENNPQPFRAGDVTVVSRNILHTTYSSPGESSLWAYLFMEPEHLIPPYLRQSLEEAELLDEIEQNICRIFPRTEYPQVYFFADRIAKNLENKPANYAADVRALCVSFMIELMRIRSGTTSAEHDANARNTLILAPALDFIQDNYSQQFRMEKLAELCRMSLTHFRRVFGEIMSCSPLEFVHRTRATAARNLLRGTNMSILEISERVGYMSISCFNRHFLRETGINPSEWRKNNTEVPRQNISVYPGWTLPENSKERGGAEVGHQI